MGACDGVEISNTFVLEKFFDWNGILVEPSKSYHNDLKKNRNWKIDFRCVYNVSGKNVISNSTNNPSISTIDLFSNADRFELD